MNELIKYFEALEARLAAQDARIAKLEKVAGESLPMLEEMQRNADEIKGHLSAMQQILDEAMQAQAEPEVEVDLIYPEDEEATVELPKEDVVSAEPTEQAEAPVVEPEPQPEPEPVVEPQPVVEPEPAPAPAPAPQPEAPRAPQQTSLFGAAVADIRQAVSIGDRFLFQRELFGGNAEKLQQTLTELNTLHSFDEAVAFIERFGWDKQSPTHELFLNVLHRRFQ
jgi:outer membrane biosynthesis protein TonB